MANRLKTVEFSFARLASVVSGTLTALTQRTIYLPETTKTIRKVALKLTADDIITASGGTISVRRLECRLGAAAFTSSNNTNQSVNSVENLSLYHSVDVTSHFTTNWTGASMTMDAQVQLSQSSGTPTGFVNIGLTVLITYEYDDTATTQIKTVYIPLDCPVGALATAKPGVANATIPALDTFCPEASKTYRDLFITVQGNESTNTSTVDTTLSIQIDSLAADTSGNHEAALASDRWFRHIWNMTALGMTTNATHGFFIWAAVARFNHVQAWLTVTYEFSPSSTTSVLNSLLIPLMFIDPMGGTASTDAQRGRATIWVEEPNTITVQNSAVLVFWSQIAQTDGVNIRINAQSFQSYTPVASVLCGAVGCMRRCESAITLARGSNLITCDIYRTDTTDLGFMVSAMLILNYTSGKASAGVGAHNHTVQWSLLAVETNVLARLTFTSAVAPNIPDADYYMSSIGVGATIFTSGTDNQVGFVMQCERLSAEGGPAWECLGAKLVQTDPEVGAFPIYGQDVMGLFKRYPNDPKPRSMDLETARRWRIGGASALANANYSTTAYLMMTYHSITFTVSGSVTDYTGNGSGIAVNLARVSDGEPLLSMTTAAGGSFSGSWYDDTENLFVHAQQDATHVGRSANAVAA
jgi:hypothetical protein